MPFKKYSVESIHNKGYDYKIVVYNGSDAIHLDSDEQINIGDYLFFDDDNGYLGHCTPGQFTRTYFKKNTERRVLKLVHFTDINNLENIKKHGLCSKSHLNKNRIVYYSNDEQRMDGIVQGICLTVNYVNHFLLNSFKRKYRKKQYVVLYIHPNILYNLLPTEPIFRVYFNHNAASSYAKSSIIDIEIMFQERFDIKIYDYYSYDWVNKTYKRDNLNEYQTTSPQAEVVIYDRIPPEYIFLDEDLKISIKDMKK